MKINWIFFWFVTSLAYQFQDVNLTILITLPSLYQESDSPITIPFTFNIADSQLITATNSFCEEYRSWQIDCERLFKEITQLRYNYLEQEMIRMEMEKKTEIINTQFIPNKHLQRSVFAMDTEMNNHFKRQEGIDAMELRLPYAIEQVVEQLKQLPRPFSPSPLIKFAVNIAFIHSCSIEGENHRILKDLLVIIRNAGLLHELSKLFIINYGILLTLEDLPDFQFPTIHIIHVSNDTSHFEVPTMKIMQNSLQAYGIEHPNHSVAILYLHTKGVSYQQIYPQIEDWRHYMLYFLVEKYQTCLSLLNSGEFDAIGVNYKSNPRDFRGNFWWTTSEHVKRLPPLILSQTNKYTAEKWLHMLDHYRVYSMHEAEVDHHHQRYPREMYVHDLPLVATEDRNSVNSALCIGYTLYWDKRSKS